jgi:hypothetical protein
MKRNLLRNIAVAAAGAAIIGTVTLARAASICGVFYQDVSFTGAQFVVENPQSVNVPGWLDNQISSMKLYENCFCVTWTNANFSGNQGFWGTNHDFEDMSEFGLVFNDSTSSIQCWVP